PSLSRRRAATVRRGRRSCAAQLRTIRCGLERQLGQGAPRSADEDRDRAPGRHELPAGGHRRRLAGEDRDFLRRIEEQPFPAGGLPLPGPHQPGDVHSRGGELRGSCVRRRSRLRSGCMLFRLARACAKRQQGKRGRGFHSVTWCTLRTFGSLRSRSSTSAEAAPSTFTSARASPLWRSRARANWAMFTCASPRVRPTLPITPGLSSLCITRIAPSGTASSSNLSTRTRRGSRLPTMVPDTELLTLLPQRRRTVTRLAKSGVSLIFTSFTDRPRSRASSGALTSFTGSARNVPKTPLSTAAVSGAEGCSATSPA